MSKTLQWFRIGAPVPDRARFIKTEVREENVKWHSDHYMLPDYKTYDAVEYALYEVPYEVGPAPEAQDGK